MPYDCVRNVWRTSRNASRRASTNRVQANENPKQRGLRKDQTLSAWDRFDQYADGMTVGEYISKMRLLGVEARKAVVDVAWDMSARHFP
jgi:hypothetical protein